MMRSWPAAKLRELMYASRLPSGDQTGSTSKPSPEVSRDIGPPEDGIVQIAPWYEKAIRSPAADNRGWIAPNARIAGSGFASRGESVVGCDNSAATRIKPSEN